MKKGANARRALYLWGTRFLDASVDGESAWLIPDERRSTWSSGHSSASTAACEFLIWVAGSGAVALARKSARPVIQMCGTDISEDALRCARLNAEQLAWT